MTSRLGIRCSILFLINVFVLNSNSFGSDISDSLFNVYSKQNESESRLSNYKDSDEILKLKIIQLAIINKSRARYKAQPVELDILASRVANKMCKEAAENNFTGHWNMKGEKPYHRYAFAGGFDHVCENAAGISTSGSFEVANENIKKFMKECHKSFMAEKAPNNGHKKTCIDKHHNFVGIGVYLINNQFRYYEEFLDRYYTFKDVPIEVKTDQEFSFEVETGKDNYLLFCVVFREKFPKSKSSSRLKLKGGYKDYSSKKACEIKPWELAKLREGNKYELTFKFKRSGLYYIQIYQHKKEYENPSSFSTKNKIQGSGIVIRVEK